MGQGRLTDMDGFELGAPAIVCRWRLANRRLPLANRHLRALAAREVDGEPVSKELIAWAKQHIEWTLEQGTADCPNGVLMLIVDVAGRAAMSAGPYEPLEDKSLRGLRVRADRALAEGSRTRVAPETLWIARGDQLYWDVGPRGVASGMTSLVEQLSLTLGIRMHKTSGLNEGITSKAIAFDEAFLVSDEHGVVPAKDALGTYGTRMQDGYRRLLRRGV